MVGTSGGILRRDDVARVRPVVAGSLPSPPEQAARTTAIASCIFCISTEPCSVGACAFRLSMSVSTTDPLLDMCLQTRNSFVGPCPPFESPVVVDGRFSCHGSAPCTTMLSPNVLEPRPLRFEPSLDALECFLTTTSCCTCRLIVSAAQLPAVPGARTSTNDGNPSICFCLTWLHADVRPRTGLEDPSDEERVRGWSEGRREDQGAHR